MQFHAALGRAFWGIPDLGIAEDADLAMGSSGRSGLFKMTKVERIRQVAGQFVKAVILSIVGAQDMQRGHPDIGKAAVQVIFFAGDDVGHLGLAQMSRRSGSDRLRS